MPSAHVLTHNEDGANAVASVLDRRLPRRQAGSGRAYGSSAGSPHDQPEYDEVDMTIVPMIQSHSRMTVGEYGPPIMYVQFGILSGSGESTSNVFGYILTFDWKTARSPALSSLWRMVARTNGSQLGRDMFRDEHMRQVVERRAVLMVDHISLQWRTAAFCRRTLQVPSFHFAREHVDENPLSFLMSRAMRRDLRRRVYSSGACPGHEGSLATAAR
ncbi:hypothetical protein HPB49_026485 [Dermacentor silvarum]|nr:hypothetical protein HPB49_026485 [Dermacentor silvarum]